MDSPFNSPAADFDHPIDILDGCHQRIRRQCALIEKLAAHLPLKGGDVEARDVAAFVLRYFDTAAAHHHRDEEDDLFPALEHHAPSVELNSVRSLVFRLRSDHDKLESLWAGVRARLAAIVAGSDGGLTPEIARDFSSAYDRHIALEEAELLPLARRVLDERSVLRIGGAMARRRGVVLRAT